MDITNKRGSERYLWDAHASGVSEHKELSSKFGFRIYENAGGEFFAKPTHIFEYLGRKSLAIKYKDIADKGAILLGKKRYTNGIVQEIKLVRIANFKGVHLTNETAQQRLDELLREVGLAISAKQEPRTPPFGAGRDRRISELEIACRAIPRLLARIEKLEAATKNQKKSWLRFFGIGA